VRLIPLALALAAATTACSASLSVDPQATAPRGAELLRTYGCGTCHPVPGVPGAQGQVGPPLGNFGERRVIAGRLPNNADNAVLWIRDPQRIDPLTVMPDLGVSEREAEAIVAYLYGLE
jgi:cytochrome c1